MPEYWNGGAVGNATGTNPEPEDAGTVDVGRVDDVADLRKIRAFLAKAGELRRNVTAHDVSRVLDARAAEHARAERLAEAVDAWMRFAHHAADRRWTIPLWGALLWERAIDASNAALAGDAPGRGED